MQVTIRFRDGSERTLENISETIGRDNGTWLVFRSGEVVDAYGGFSKHVAKPTAEYSFREELVASFDQTEINEE